MVQRRALRWIAALAATLLITMSSSFAQESAGSLGGSVTNADFGGWVEGATVQIVETRQSTQTDERGRFSFPEVRQGVYTVVVSKV
ncbi:MAG: carboxypeptidase regulatory-like domain-containing protein, partial [Planctomycetota bacterium]